MTHLANFPPRMPDRWPRLTETLPHREPNQCASCGTRNTPEFWTLTTWMEHDRDDRPEMRYVILCRACSDRIIEPHPRLYAPLPLYTPAPGAMEICTDCVHRDGTCCRSPKATPNGGPGMTLVGPEPTRVHFYRRGKGARSGWEEIYPGPVIDCDGKEPSS